MRIALVGNQNSGKTTLFNLLTGSNQKVGNWPGVTIERKTGIIKQTNYELIDLPGIYSLSPYTSEEEVSRQFIFNEKPDLIINIIDATSIERSLYLTTQLLELDSKVVIALNMSDMMLKKGVEIDVDRLSDELGVDIVKISALKKTGILDLIEVIKNNNLRQKQLKKIYVDEIEKAITDIENNISSVHKRFVAVKLLEKDKMFNNFQNKSVMQSIDKIESSFGIDMEEIIANLRYEWIVGVKKRSVVTQIMNESTTDKLDKIFLNKYFAIPIFMIIMFLVYYLSVGVVGGFTVELIEALFENFGSWVSQVLNNANVSSWINSLIVNGIIAGVGAILNFIPQLIILFLCISILETTGYMARISFLLDKLFKKFGLSGKSLIPFIVGSGCSVPGVMATRTIDDISERRMSIVLTPFIPCSAKLPIIALFAGFFFGQHSGLVSASLYFFSVIVILFSALIMKKFFFKGESSAFLLELPEYKTPSTRYVVRDVFEKTWAFIKRAGTIILLASIVIWFLLSFSWEMEYGIDINNSILAWIGNLFSWVFYPMLGEMSWGATVSAIQGLVAKEQVVSSMAIISGFSEEISDGHLIFGSSGIFSFFTGASAYAFMVFNIFSAPCFATVGAMRREFNSTKHMMLAIIFQTGLAWVLATIVYWSLTLIGVMIN